MNLNGLFTLDWKSIVRGLVMAVIGAILTAIYQTLSVGGPISIQAMLTVGTLAGLSYIIKSFFSDNQGQVFGRI